MSRPALIAIVAHQELAADGIIMSDHEVVGSPYVRAVHRVGAVPVLLPVPEPTDPAAIVDLVERFDGIILTGGSDLDPATYGGAPDPAIGVTNPDRDRRDLAVARACVERNRPTLAICRGVQVLAVATGGTLVAHIDGHMDVEHFNGPAHGLRVQPGSTMAGLLGAEHWGNSLHHQQIAELGEAGARVVAWAPDGTIEAIELAEATNVIGVQWHPEMLRYDPAHLGLFRWLARGGR